MFQAEWASLHDRGLGNKLFRAGFGSGNVMGPGVRVRRVMGFHQLMLLLLEVTINFLVRERKRAASDNGGARHVTLLQQTMRLFHNVPLAAPGISKSIVLYRYMS